MYRPYRLRWLETTPRRNDVARRATRLFKRMDIIFETAGRIVAFAAPFTAAPGNYIVRVRACFTNTCVTDSAVVKITPFVFTAQ